MSSAGLPELGHRLSGDLDQLCSFAEEVARADGGLPSRINADPTRLERSLARLVLTLIELIRQVLEKQALRRMEGGSLSEEQIERMGETFLLLDRRMGEMKQAFGLADDDLELRLGRLEELL